MDNFAINTAFWAQMAPEQTGVLVGTIIGFFVGLVIGALIGGLILRLATNLVCSIDIPYGQAVLYSFMLGVLTLVISFPLGFVGGIILGPEGLAKGGMFLIQGLSALLGLAISAFFYGIVIKNEQGRPIGAGKGFLITVTILGIWIGIAIVMFGFVVSLMLATGAFR